MKLLFLPASPYARKVRVFAHETGLNDQIEQVLVASTLTPVQPDQNLVDKNPIGKVPTLILDDGSSIFDSRVICEYLDTLHDRPLLFPDDGKARWFALTCQALADGILDAAVLARYEQVVRPEQYQWDEWIRNQKEKFRRALKTLESDVDSLKGSLDIGSISTACALGYLDFRFPEENWREGCSSLAAWFEEFSKRESMTTTRPE